MAVRRILEKKNKDWVCPWGICRHEKALACRAEMGLLRDGTRKGCGSRFPPETTPEQARMMVGSLHNKI